MTRKPAEVIRPRAYARNSAWSSTRSTPCIGPMMASGESGGYGASTGSGSGARTRVVGPPALYRRDAGPSVGTRIDDGQRRFGRGSSCPVEPALQVVGAVADDGWQPRWSFWLRSSVSVLAR